jgi:hypothetical protein
MARPIAVLKLSPKVKNIIAYAQSIATAMTGNSFFPSPIPPLAIFEADISALNAAESAVLTRAKGAAVTRNAKLGVVHGDIKSMATYVQGVADAANPASAEAIIESSGLEVRKTTQRDKPALAVKSGPVSGSVKLSAKAAGHRAAYDWEYSTDQKTWTPLAQTLQSKTTASGLTAGTVYYFRFQALTKTGTENWSQVVSLLVS